MADGILSMVGAGPGDPGLITVRGKELIEQADVLVYDYLANKVLLQWARPDAELIYVGKMGGDHTKTQDEINQIIVDLCKQGKNVCRLKGGDPYIFGRGGEEAQELVKAGIRFEVVPGVTAGAAASAYAGIPLTHRDHTTDVAFVTGHEDPNKERSSLNWEKMATAVGTLVFYMGIKNLPNIVKNLIDNGRPADTPVAVIRWGTRPEQETVTGTLETIVEVVQKAGIKAPAITVVGTVVKLREELRWFDTKPLFGRKIVVTRAREQASDFASLLTAQGAEVIEFPTIETVKPDSWEELDASIDLLPSGYDWVVFTSVNGVRFFVDRLKERGRDIRALAGLKICCIGPKTAEAVEALGVTVDLLPEEYRAESLIEALGGESLQGVRFLIPRAKVAREVLPDELRKMGAEVTVATTYVTVRPDERRDEVRNLFEDGKIDAVTFTSSSTAENFVAMWESPEEAVRLLGKTSVASIGPITSETADKLGLKPAIEAHPYTTAALCEALVENLGSNR